MSQEAIVNDMPASLYAQAELDFKNLDKNKDGRLDKNEIRRHLQKIGQGYNMHDREVIHKQFFD